MRPKLRDSIVFTRAFAFVLQGVCWFEVSARDVKSSASGLEFELSPYLVWWSRQLGHSEPQIPEPEPVEQSYS